MKRAPPEASAAQKNNTRDVDDVGGQLRVGGGQHVGKDAGVRLRLVVRQQHDVLLGGQLRRDLVPPGGYDQGGGAKEGGGGRR